MTKVTTIKKPAKGEVHCYFFISDLHSEHLHQPTYDIFIKHLKMIPREQRRVVIGGDFLDCLHLMLKDGAMKKAAKKVDVIKDILIPQSEIEFEWGNMILDEIQKYCDYVYFISGNHDTRYHKWLTYCPSEYAHHFDLPRRLNLKERGIPYVSYNDYLDVGTLSMTHGMWHSTTHLKKHIDGTDNYNIIYGHLHHGDSKSFYTRGKLKKAWSNPCMSALNPDYIKNRDTNWTNGYITFQMKSNGNFNLQVHEIFDNELILSNGKIINAD